MGAILLHHRLPIFESEAGSVRAIAENLQQGTSLLADKNCETTFD